MSKILKLGSLFFMLAIFLTSCAKLPQTPAKEGALPMESLAQTNSIPADWGKLVSVTISPDFPRQVQLWFQDEKGDIHLAFYEMAQNKLSPDAIVFRRN